MTFSTSFFLYTRCPALDFSGARPGNSVSQNRRTYGSTTTMSQTSLILKNSLSGISCVGIFQTLLDYNRRTREWKSFPDTVFNKPLERKVKFLHLIRKHHERRWIDFNLRDVSNFQIRRQPAARERLVP